MEIGIPLNRSLISGEITVMRTTTFKGVIAASAVATALTAPASVHAAGISVTLFGGDLVGANADFDTQRNTFDDFFVTEGFETSPLGEVTNGGSLSTAVGSFTTYADGNGNTGVGTGSSVRDDNGTSGGDNVAVREDIETNDGGRFDTSEDDLKPGQTNNANGRYLDSNDTWGITWTAQDTLTNKQFDRLLFTLTDPGDQGLTLNINDGMHSEDVAPGGVNGNIVNVLITFDTLQSSATIDLFKTAGLGGALDTNDGFSVDNATVGAVPLPAAAWLLLGVSGGLIVAKRRQARKAA